MKRNIEKGAAPFYTNSTQLPVNYTDDIFEALELQDELQARYTGGTVLHFYLGEQVSDIEAIKALIKKVVNNFRLPYFTLTPTFSVCPSHGYLNGEQKQCSGLRERDRSLFAGRWIFEARQAVERRETSRICNKRGV